MAILPHGKHSMMKGNRRKPGRVLGLIPAKGGSIRLPRKNIRKLAGKTLLQRAIEAAQQSGVINHLSVSTEDEQIATEAKQLGVDVPFMRPTYLSKDPYGVVDVALHALDEWERLGKCFQTLVILLPTSPFRNQYCIEVLSGSRG